jgi:anaerobic magnesium-protoporphyrin IX monomethyl ester cyclase
MRVHLIGADFEENLGLGILASVLERAGHRADILPFNVPADGPPLIRRILDEQPEVVGLGIQFQHRAHEFLSLARKLRAAGYRGHVTSGAQFPTLAFKEVLEGDHGVDSVVLHDGEDTLLDLVSAIERGAPAHGVAGLAILGHDGVAFRTEERRMPDDLDAFPFARRYRPHNRHMGIPFVPVIGSRGCWSKCSYCSIVAFYRDGREHGGGRLLRLRTPENIAAELALLWHRAGGPCIFCFHDDNFTLPNPELTLKRVRDIRAALDEYGVGKVAFVGKARPDTITPELAHELAELGVIRLYVGVENASQAGGDHLRRGTQQKHVREALKSCREAGIFNCYNLLMFEPDATLDIIAENTAFMRDHADHPVNFCRAEPYHGTPLHLEMERNQDLGGSYLGWNYRIHDDRTELLFRVCSAVFRERNFAPRGIANRYMGLGYAGNVLRRFYGGERAEVLRRRANALTRSISLDTAGYLERALDFVRNAKLSDREGFERKTARLALEIAAADQNWHRELDELYGDMQKFTGEPHVWDKPAPTRKFVKLKQSVALGATVLALSTAACDCDDAGPGDAGFDSGMVVDPPPPDAGFDASGMDAGDDSGMVVDPPPPDAGFDAASLDAGVDAGMVVDPPPMDQGMSALPEAEDDAAFAETGEPKRRLRLMDQWRDSSPRNGVRTDDLPLSDPPAPELSATRTGASVRVRIGGVRVPFSTRWEAEGEVRGDGPEIEWIPADETDQLRVAVRTRGGVAVVTLRASGIASGESLNESS